MPRRPNQPPSGSSLWRRLIHGSSAVTLVLAAAGTTGSAATEGVLTVSARVLPRATLQVRSAPPELRISAADVRQAYVDVSEPTRVDVSNNSPQGYALLVSPNMPGFTAVLVRGAGVPVTLAGNGGVIPEPGRVGVRMPLSLRYRFMLDPGIEPGRYAWPVQLTVRPLAP